MNSFDVQIIFYSFEICLSRGSVSVSFNPQYVNLFVVNSQIISIGLLCTHLKIKSGISLHQVFGFLHSGTGDFFVSLSHDCLFVNKPSKLAAHRLVHHRRTFRNCSPILRVFTKLVRVSKPSAVRSVTGVLELCYRLNCAAQPTVLRLWWREQLPTLPVLQLPWRRAPCRAGRGCSSLSNVTARRVQRVTCTRLRNTRSYVTRGWRHQPATLGPLVVRGGNTLDPYDLISYK